MFLKALKASKVFRHKALGFAYLGKSNSLLVLKAVYLELEYALLAYQDTFDVAGHLAKDIFKATTRGLLV